MCDVQLLCSGFVQHPLFLACPPQLNPLHPNISIHILHTVFHTLPNVLRRRICRTIKSFFSWGSLSWSLWPQYLIHGWYCKEKLDGSDQDRDCLKAFLFNLIQMTRILLSSVCYISWWTIPCTLPWCLCLLRVTRL